MRITTSMMNNHYIKNIRTISDQVTRANKVASTGRGILKGSDDAVSTISIYRLRNQQRSNEIYDKAVKDVDGYLTTAESGLMHISENLSSAQTSLIQGITGTSGPDEREVIASEIENIQQSIYTTLNAEFTGKYVFGGGGREDKPYSLDDNGRLVYRGVPVDDNTRKGDLDMLASEKIEININSGKIADSGGELTNVFDSTVSGIKFMGYGSDENGVSHNIYNLLEDIKNELRSPDYDIDNMTKYMDNLNEQKVQVSIAISDLGGKTNHLENIRTRNLDIKYDSEDKLGDIEYVDYTEALVDFQMKQYALTAAVSMGAKIMQNSIIDFIR